MTVGIAKALVGQGVYPRELTTVSHVDAEEVHSRLGAARKKIRNSIGCKTVDGCDCWFVGMCHAIKKTKSLAW